MSLSTPLEKLRLRGTQFFNERAPDVGKLRRNGVVLAHQHAGHGPNGRIVALGGFVGSELALTDVGNLLKNCFEGKAQRQKQSRAVEHFDLFRIGLNPGHSAVSSSFVAPASFDSPSNQEPNSSTTRCTTGSARKR